GILAIELGVARSTVVTVFEQLAAEGYIAARPGSGYFVPEALIEIDDRSRGNPTAVAPRPVSRQAALLAGLAAPPAKPPRPFDLGHAEIDGRFIATWKRLAARALSGRSRLSWGYGDPQGEPALRQAIAEYPLGMAMPLARRMALLAWAETAGAWIVEDDYESEFQQPAGMLPSLQGLDRAGRVIYLGTFSKLLFPSLRLGYAVLPEDLVRP